MPKKAFYLPNSDEIWLTLTNTSVVVIDGATYDVKLTFFFQEEDGIRHLYVTGVQTCALPICRALRWRRAAPRVDRRTPGCRRSRGYRKFLSARRSAMERRGLGCLLRRSRAADQFAGLHRQQSRLHSDPRRTEDRPSRQSYTGE